MGPEFAGEFEEGSHTRQVYIVASYSVLKPSALSSSLPLSLPWPPRNGIAAEDSSGIKSSGIMTGAKFLRMSAAVNRRVLCSELFFSFSAFHSVFWLCAGGILSELWFGLCDDSLGVCVWLEREVV